MANTLESVDLTGEDWVDLNTLSTVPAGTAIDIQNQSSSPIMVAISPTKPALTFRGFVIPADLSAVASIASGESTVWAFGVGPVNVQVA